MKKMGVNSDEILAKAHKAVGLLPQVSGVQGQTIRTMMCITLSGFDILMTEQFGYPVEIYFTLCQPCSKVLSFSYLLFNPLLIDSPTSWLTMFTRLFTSILCFFN